MQKQLNINDLHDLLRFDPEQAPASLDVVVVTDPMQPRTPLTSTVTTPRGQARFTHEGMAVKFLNSLLQYYPVPVTVNGTPVERRLAHDGPAVSRIIHRHQNIPDRETLLSSIPHPDPAFSPQITCDGLAYRHTPTERNKFFDTPRPEDNNLPWIPVHLNRLTHHIIITTNPRTRGDYDFNRARTSPEVILNKNASERLRRLIATQRDQATKIAGYSGDWKHLNQLRHHITWDSHAVFLKETAIPVTIELPATHYGDKPPGTSFHQVPQTPTAHSVHHALLHNPSSNLAPVMPPIPSTNQPLTDVELTGVTLSYQDGPTIDVTHADATAVLDLPAKLATEITIHVRLRHPDGSSSQADLPTNLVMLGDYTHEQPVLTHAYPNQPQQLAQALTAAYFHPKPGQPRYESPHDDDCCHSPDYLEQYQEAMLTLAVHTLHGPLAALHHEVVHHWNQFDPTTKLPPGADIKSVIAQALNQTSQI